MTSAQNTTQLKGQNLLGGLLAAVLAALLIAVIAVGISARPVAAPTTVKPDVYLPSLHDRHLAVKPDVYLPSLHDQHLAMPAVRTPAFHDRHRTTWKPAESTYIPSLLKPPVHPRLPVPPYPDQVRHPGGPFRAQ